MTNSRRNTKKTSYASAVKKRSQNPIANKGQTPPLQDDNNNLEMGDESIVQDSYVSKEHPELNRLLNKTVSPKPPQQLFDAENSAAEKNDHPEDGPINDDQVETSELVDEEMDQALIVVKRPTIYIAAAPFNEVPGGKFFYNKKTYCLKKFTGHELGYDVGQRKYKKEMFMVIFFNNEEYFNKFLSSPHKYTTKNGDDIEEKEIIFQDFTKIKPIRSSSDEDEDNQNTIKVLDIPLQMKSHILRAVFSAYGEIKAIRMQTRGIYQRAYIVYTNNDAVSHFKSHWSVYVLKDRVKVIPMMLNEQELEDRQKFCLKLAGLPRGTRAHDLNDILARINAQTCFIPRHPKSYQPLAHAYINFGNEKDYAEATLQFFEFEGKVLHWVDPEMQTCHKCGVPDHVAIDCNNVKVNKISPNQASLYRKFKPANFKKQKQTKSKDHIARQTNIQHSQMERQKEDQTIQQINPNLKTGTKEGGSLHGSETERVKAQVQEIKKSMESMWNQLQKLQEDYNNDKKTYNQQQPKLSTVGSRSQNSSGVSGTKRTRDDTDKDSPNNKDQQQIQKKQKDKAKDNSQFHNALPNFDKYDSLIGDLGNQMSQMISCINNLANNLT